MSRLQGFSVKTETVGLETSLLVIKALLSTRDCITDYSLRVRLRLIKWLVDCVDSKRKKGSHILTHFDTYTHTHTQNCWQHLCTVRLFTDCKRGEINKCYDPLLKLLFFSPSLHFWVHTLIPSFPSSLWSSSPPSGQLCLKQASLILRTSYSLKPTGGDMTPFKVSLQWRLEVLLTDGSIKGWSL